MVRYAVGAVFAGALALALSAEAPPAIEKAMSGWPERAKIAARATLERYGPPDEIGPDALVWWDNGPWKRTVVYRRAWPHYEGAEDKDYLENTVGYRVPGAKLDELSRFDGKFDADARYEEMSSRSESEAMNFLILNLAYEIVSGRRGLPDARRFASRTARLAAAGKSSPYLEKLMFVSRRRGAPPRADVRALGGNP